MNKIAIGSALAALSLALPAAAPAQRAAAPVIVIVDVDRVFRECNACRTAQTQLQAQVQQIQTRAQQLQQPLATEEASIRAALGNRTTPDAATQTRIQAFETKQNAAAQELQRSQATFQRNQAYVAQQIQARLNPVVQQVMTARGANLALDVRATLAHGPALDVTNDVLAQLNTALPSVNVTAPAAPAQQQPTGR